MDRVNHAKSGRSNPVSVAQSGASLVAMINPTSPNLGASKQIGQATVGLGRDLGSTSAMPITGKKNSGAATYARGRQEL